MAGAFLCRAVQENAFQVDCDDAATPGHFLVPKYPRVPDERRKKIREPRKLKRYRHEIRLLTERARALSDALTRAEVARSAEALSTAMQLAQEVEIDLTQYLECRRMAHVIAITLLLLEDI